jgi:formiminoglutamase
LDWLEVHRGDAPIILTIPHTGSEIPQEIERTLVSASLARKDTDWWIHDLYAFAVDLGVTVVRSKVSRTVIDLNRNPSGGSLYPGQATTDLCPKTTFDGEPLYRSGAEPDTEEVERRKAAWFWPYHHEVVDQIERLQKRHSTVVLYDAHSIRSVIPRLFEGELPHMNIGTDDGKTCDDWLANVVYDQCSRSEFTSVLNGRFRGGWTVRHHGRRGSRVQAIQMELAMRGYMAEPTESSVPMYETARAMPMISVLQGILHSILDSQPK